MLLRSLARQTVIGGQTLLCTRYRHPDTKPSDETIEIRSDQKLINLPLMKHTGKPPSVTIGKMWKNLANSFKLNVDSIDLTFSMILDPHLELGYITGLN